MESNVPARSRIVRAVMACVTLIVLALAFLAFHDIGHGEADLANEYGMLVVGAAWVLFVAVWLLWTGRRVYGALSVVALAGVAWGTRNGALARPPRFGAYAAAIAGFIWLVVLSGIMLRRRGRNSGRMTSSTFLAIALLVGPSAGTHGQRPAEKPAAVHASRDLVLEREASARADRLAVHLTPEARAKLDQVTRALIAHLATGNDSPEITALVAGEVRNRFPHLSPAQAHLLGFYAMADAARRLSRASTEKSDVGGDMTEIVDERLQMTMDRRSKFISTLSQMMKKTSSTQDTLVQNIK